MKKYLNWINIALRGTVLLFLPGLLIFYLFYKVIFDVEMDIYWLTILMALVTFIYDLIKKYKHETTEERLQTLDETERIISKKRWEVLLHDRTKLVVRPKFDFPFNFMLSDQVEVFLASRRVKIAGPRLYIEEFSKEIRGEVTEDTDKKITMRNVMVGIICTFFFFLPIVEWDVYWQAKVMYHNAFADKNEVVAQTEDILGNSAENILNQGYGVAGDEYNFYIEDDTEIVRTDKNFQNKKYLTDNGEQMAYSDLNLAGDWLYFVEGTAINRIKTDGLDKEVIQNIDIPMDVQISGEWIYYISIEDESNVYRMNLNGENLERVNLKDKSREVQFDLVSTNFIEWDGYYYYTGANSKLMRVQIETPSNPEVLVDEYVTSFTITDQSLIYTVESTYDTKIYISNIDGSNEQRIPGKSSMVDGLTKLGDSVLFYTWNSNGYATVNRFDLNINEVKRMDELVLE